MKQNSKYKCNHLKGEVLTVTRKYNDKQFRVTSDKTDKDYLVGVDSFNEPHLSLAHVANTECELIKIEEEHKW